MTIRSRVEKLEAKEPSGCPPFQIVMLGPDDPDPVDAIERRDWRGVPMVTHIRIVGVSPERRPD